MTKNNGTGTAIAVLSIIDEINAGIAAVTPEQYALPQIGIRAGDKPVGEADDYLKRFFTYRSVEIDLHVTRVNQYRELAAELDILARDKEDDSRAARFRRAFFGTAANPDIEAKIIRLEELERAITAKIPFLEVLGSIFWAEVRRRIPALAKISSIGIRSDWQFVISKQEKSPLAKILESGLVLEVDGMLHDLGEGDPEPGSAGMMDIVRRLMGGHHFGGKPL